MARGKSDIPEKSSLLQKLARQLFDSPETQQDFVNALSTKQEYPDAVLWTKSRPTDAPFTLEPRLAWQASFVDRVAPEQRPGLNSLHADGHYYCLDLSSVFAATVLSAIGSPIETVVDVCSAPGGKAMFAAQQFKPQKLFCNEVVPDRRRQLRANLQRCGIENFEIKASDPTPLAKEFPACIDLVMVDAPCSGQSLPAKGQKAPGCFHPVSINKNAQRQRRIIANAASMVKPGGYLAYMTCTFATKENEEIITWLRKQFVDFESVEVKCLADYSTNYSADYCYRMWPQDRLGAGSFTTLLRRTL